MSAVYIEKVEIKNYRQCQNTIFHPDKELSVLIGPNGSGKTSILRAILLLKQFTRPSYHYGAEDIQRRIARDGPVQITVDLSINKIKLRHKARLLITSDNSNQDTVIWSDHEWSFLNGRSTGTKYVLPIEQLSGRWPSRIYRNKKISTSVPIREIFPKLKPAHLKTIQMALEFYRNFNYYGASRFTNASQCPVSFELENENSFYSPKNAATTWLTDLYKSSVEEKQKFKDYVEVIGKNGMKLVDDLTFKSFNSSKRETSVTIGAKINKQIKQNKIIVPYVKVGKSVLSPSQLSEGTFKTLVLAYYLMVGKSTLIMLEEPEVCVHHGLLASIIELVKAHSKDQQIVISTHSDFVLDAVSPEQVHFVERLKTGVKVSALQKQLSRTDVSALKSFLNSEGNLGEYWKRGGFDG